MEHSIVGLKYKLPERSIGAWVYDDSLTLIRSFTHSEHSRLENIVSIEELLLRVRLQPDTALNYIEITIVFMKTTFAINISVSSTI